MDMLIPSSDEHKMFLENIGQPPNKSWTGAPQDGPKGKKKANKDRRDDRQDAQKNEDEDESSSSYDSKKDEDLSSTSSKDDSNVVVVKGYKNPTIFVERDEDIDNA
jgi:hypothetical protein